MRPLPLHLGSRECLYIHAHTCHLFPPTVKGSTNAYTVTHTWVLSPPRCGKTLSTSAQVHASPSVPREGEPSTPMQTHTWVLSPPLGGRQGCFPQSHKYMLPLPSAGGSANALTHKHTQTDMHPSAEGDKKAFHINTPKIPFSPPREKP